MSIQEGGGNVSYLALKEFQGKRVDIDNEYSVSNTVTETDIGTRTAGAGKDLYLVEASLIFDGGSSGTFSTTFRLYVNGTEVEQITKAVSSSTEGTKIKFDVKAVNVSATEIIKITLEMSSANAANITIGYANMILFEEDTGEEP